MKKFITVSALITLGVASAATQSALFSSDLSVSSQPIGSSIDGDTITTEICTESIAPQNQILIDDRTIKPISPTMVDLAVSKISNQERYIHGRQDNVIEFTLNNYGITDVNNNHYIITFDDDIVINNQIDIEAQGTRDLKLRGPLAHLPVGKHTFTVTFNNDQDTDKSNNTMTREFYIVADSVAF